MNSDRSCYAYGRDLETTDQFTIRSAPAHRAPSRSHCVRRLHCTGAGEAGYPGIRLAWLETVLADGIVASPRRSHRQFTSMLEG